MFVRLQIDRLMLEVGSLPSSTEEALTKTFAEMRARAENAEVLRGAGSIVSNQKCGWHESPLAGGWFELTQLDPDNFPKINIGLNDLAAVSVLVEPDPTSPKIKGVAHLTIGEHTTLLFSDPEELRIFLRECRQIWEFLYGTPPGGQIAKSP